MSDAPKKTSESASTKKDPNRIVAKIWNEKGPKAAVSEMFKHPETKQPLSYGEMRDFYG